MTVKSLPTKELSVEQMSTLYDRIYSIADRLLKRHNPCNIRKLKSGKVYCNNYNKRYGESHKNTLCCSSCKHWNNGCTIKCLACKLYSCSFIDRKIRKRLKILLDISSKHLNIGSRKRNIVFHYYESKEEWLKLLKESRSEKTVKATTSV